MPHCVTFIDLKQTSNSSRDLTTRAIIVSSLEWGWHGNDFKGVFERLSNQATCFADISVSSLEWGWHGNDFKGVFERLSNQATCFADISARHDTIATIMKNRPVVSEEKRTSQVFYLIDRKAQRADPKKFKTIADIKRIYGDQVETALREIQDIAETIEKLLKVFTPSTFMAALRADVSRMDRIVELMTQYETGKLQRRAWAEKMQSRQMRHFFDDEFSEGWYQPILHDLEHSLYKVIVDVEKEYWPKFKSYMLNGTAIKITSLLLFDDISIENEEILNQFINEVYNCTVGDVKEVTIQTLKNFKRLYRELQSSYTNLFKKELPDYLENFEFGDKFVRENFAMVNVFLQQMHLEHWSQARTYGFWSLACDIGGALGLFLGASMLTIIELLYLCYHYKIYGKLRQKATNRYRKGVESFQSCMKPCYDACESPSSKSSRSSSFVASSRHSPVEERQKTSWINPLADPIPPSYSSSQDVTSEDPIEDYLDALDVHPPKYEVSSNDDHSLSVLSKESLQTPLEQRQPTERSSDGGKKNSGLKLNFENHPHIGRVTIPRPSGFSSSSDTPERRSKSPSFKPSRSVIKRIKSANQHRLYEPVRSSMDDEEDTSQLTDSQLTAAPKLFSADVEKQTTL
ncbi:hypothetical protein DICVIV_09526 [Dictyocaulus viviparus]|uniref:Amiloride-sensitive sodium channel n=1 Tax=Dictyocaulus viviparus TaxID=29172 RepID=A0A0D8XKZ5_DICVI|nr:hypothetical protein DICVIV_09526 [Dictyocaulus viviparus]